jgi:deoxyribonuclease V
VHDAPPDPRHGRDEVAWPATVDELDALQRALALAADDAPRWRAPAAPHDVEVGGCFVCFDRATTGRGAAGERGWAAAVCGAAVAVVAGVAGGPYVAGYAALRQGALLDAAVRSLPAAPDVLLVDATGRDHPRRAGLALHLGAVLGVPTIGVTHRPLVAAGAWPAGRRGAIEPLAIDGEEVGAWVRVQAAARPLSVHAAWRTDVATAVGIVLATTGRYRTPEPLRRARHAARSARATVIRPSQRVQHTDGS